MDTQINKTPAFKILKRVQQCGYTSAVIAGGFLRDSHFSNSPKDLDIFLWDNNAPNNTENILNIVGEDPQNPHGFFWHEAFATKENGNCVVSVKKPRFTNNINNVSKPSVVPGNSGITSVITVEIFGQLTDLVFTKNPPVSHIDSFFDIGLCKIFTDGTSVRYFPEFLRDTSQKTLTICKQTMTRKEFDRCRYVRIPHLQRKYPGYTPNAAHHLKHLM